MDQTIEQANQPQPLGRGIAYGLVAGALWGAVFLAPRMLPGFSPLELTMGRYVAYGALSVALLAPHAARLLPRVSRADWGALVWLSLLGNLIYFQFLAAAVQGAGVAAASLLVGLIPVTATLAGSFEHGAVKLRALVGPLGLISVGIVCLNVDIFSGGGLWGARLLGMAAGLGALASWTAYTVGNARYLRRKPEFTSHEWSLLTGLATGALALVLAGVTTIAPHTPAAGVPRDWGLFWAVNAAVALGASVIGNYCWNAASRLLPLTLSGQLIIFETLFALLYGFGFEARWPRPLELASAVLLTVGVAWSARLHR